MADIPPRVVKKIELLGVIGRIRRQQPRNADTMLLCDALESFVCTPELTAVSTPPHQPVCTQEAATQVGESAVLKVCPVCEARKLANRAQMTKARAARRFAAAPRSESQ